MELKPDQRFELLKAEMSILASKISGTVDTLWKVRTASLTIWTAVFGVGLGSFGASHAPVLPLLALGCLLPVIFINIDARNNRWYRRLSSREQAISEYLNDPSPESGQNIDFPVFDLSGRHTLQGDRWAMWEWSSLRSLVDPIPLTFYGGQLAFSMIACTNYMPSPWRWCFLPAAFFLAITLFGLAWRLKKRIFPTQPVSSKTCGHI